MTTTRTDTHEFYVGRSYRDEGFEVHFRPLNPKTGKPWQKNNHVEEGADVTPGNYNRPVYYSTFELAEAARDRQIAKLAKNRR